MGSGSAAYIETQLLDKLLSIHGSCTLVLELYLRAPTDFGTRFILLPTRFGA